MRRPRLTIGRVMAMTELLAIDLAVFQATRYWIIRPALAVASS